MEILLLFRSHSQLDLFKEERYDVLFLPLPPFQERYENFYENFLPHLVSYMQTDSFSNGTRKCAK